MKALHIFRRDLRLEDNTALNAALQSGREVVPLFILDPRQISAHAYRSLPGMQFMFTSLRELDAELKQKQSKLHLWYGEAHQSLDRILQLGSFDCVYINRDYTPFSTKRDEALYEICKKRGVTFFALHDALLHDPLSTKKDDGSPYTVFTPFFKKNSKSPPREPHTYRGGKFGTVAHPEIKEIDFLETLLPQTNSQLFRLGGRAEAVTILNRTLPKLSRYNELRDLPSEAGTSGLAPHHKFGTCSIRESYWVAKNNLSSDNRFISELYWRDFFTSIAYFYPHVFERSFQQKFTSLEWDDNPNSFERWCNGETGFPIVDAGMRELNETGYMHNRVRMIVASFLIKDLHINWQEGERYFAQKLIDYDPAVNNGSWQWSASTGCDAQPYFRIFNPWLQQKKFDPSAAYIKKWVPELREVDAESIHNWEEESSSFDKYPKPMLEHSLEKQITEERYNRCAKFSTSP